VSSKGSGIRDRSLPLPVAEAFTLRDLAPSGLGRRRCR